MQILTDAHLKEMLALARRLFASDEGVVCDMRPRHNGDPYLFVGELEFVVELSYLTGELIEVISFESVCDAATFIAHVCDHKKEIRPWEKFSNGAST